jgi:hypothetical protein
MKFDPEPRPVANSPAVSVSVLRRRLNKSPTDTEWRQDLLLFWLFRTCTRLQIALDWYFLPSGLTMQEARVLHRCVETRSVKAGRLANSLGKDKGRSAESSPVWCQLGSCHAMSTAAIEGVR